MELAAGAGVTGVGAVVEVVVVVVPVAVVAVPVLRAGAAATGVDRPAGDEAGLPAWGVMPLNILNSCA